MPKTALWHLEEAYSHAGSAIVHMQLLKDELEQLGFQPMDNADLQVAIFTVGEVRDRLRKRLDEARDRRGINPDGKGRKDGSTF